MKREDNIISFICDMYKAGKSYTQIVIDVQELFGVTMSSDAVRYHCVRKGKEKESIKNKLNKSGISRKLILSDLHIPYNCKEIIDIVEQHKDEIDEIIFNGDIVDCGEISKFTDIHTCSLIDEMQAVHNILNQIDQLTPNIPKVLVKGNHEIRWQRHLSSVGSPIISLHSDNILKEIVNGFTTHDFKNNTEITYGKLENYTAVDDWWYKVNDTICCHPLSFSKIKGRTATLAVDYFLQQGEEFNNIIVAHTHKMAMIKHYDKFTIEQGCLCQPMQYSKNGNLNYSPQNKGYYLAEFNNKKLDVNNSRLYFLD